jgi:hypothetical protein
MLTFLTTAYGLSCALNQAVTWHLAISMFCSAIWRANILDARHRQPRGQRRMCSNQPMDRVCWTCLPANIIPNHHQEQRKKISKDQSNAPGLMLLSQVRITPRLRSSRWPVNLCSLVLTTCGVICSQSTVLRCNRKCWMH